MIKSMVLALGFGILFDAFIVRMTIVPAVMTLMKNPAALLASRDFSRVRPPRGRLFITLS